MTRPTITVQCGICAWAARCTDDTDADAIAFLRTRVTQHFVDAHESRPIQLVQAPPS